MATDVLMNKSSSIWFENQVIEHELSNCLERLVTEIKITTDAFYPEFEFDNIEAVGSDKIYASIERTWVGLLNNAIVRGTENATLQEFSVWGEEKHPGRCDLLVQFKDGTEKLDMLVEAKCREFPNTPGNVEDLSHRLKAALLQARLYYQAEMKYYTNQTYLMSLVFSWIRNGEGLKKAKELLEGGSLRNIHLNALYWSENRGVMLNGNIEPA